MATINIFSIKYGSRGRLHVRGVAQRDEPVGGCERASAPPALSRMDCEASISFENLPPMRHLSMTKKESISVMKIISKIKKEA